MTPEAINDHELRKLLLSFPRQAVKFLYERYRNGLFKIAFSLTHDKAASEDIVQETFVYIWENCREIGKPDGRSILHYMVRIVRNKSVSYYKNNLYLSKQKIKFLRDYAGDLADHSFETQFVHLDVTQEIRNVIASFPRRERECLLMKIDEELGKMEISARLNISVKAVERSLTSAKKRLQKHLRTKQ